MVNIDIAELMINGELIMQKLGQVTDIKELILSQFDYGSLEVLEDFCEESHFKSLYSNWSRSKLLMSPKFW